MDPSSAIPDYFGQVTQTANFDPDGAFKFNGVRTYIMSAATIADLFDDFYLVLGERFVDARLYMGGRRAGARTAAAVVAVYKLDSKDKANIEKLFSDSYSALGWGRLEFYLDYDKRTGYVLVKNSFLAQGARAKWTTQGRSTAVKSATPHVARCSMLSGYVAGLVSHLFEMEVDAQETECVALDAPVCRFEITQERLYTIKR